MEKTLKNTSYKLLFLFIVFVAMFRLININQGYLGERYNLYQYHVMADKLNHIKEENVKQLLSSTSKEKSVIIYIGSDECIYCIELAPKIKRVIKKNDKLKAYYLAIDLNEEFDSVLEEYNIKTIPAIIIKNDDQLEVLTTTNIKNDF